MILSDLLNFVASLLSKITARRPPEKDTRELITNKLVFILPVSMIACGENPNRPIDLMKKTLPKTPAMVFPINPKEYFLKNSPVLLAPIIPIRILSKEISVSVIVWFEILMPVIHFINFSTHESFLNNEVNNKEYKTNNSPSKSNV